MSCKTEQRFDEWVRKNKPELYSIKNGFPDRALYNADKLILVEVKGKQESLSKVQREMLNVLKDKGLSVFVAKERETGKFDLFEPPKKDKAPKINPIALRVNKSNHDFIEKWIAAYKSNNRNQAMNDILNYAKEKWHEQGGMVTRIISDCKLNKIKLKDLQSEW